MTGRREARKECAAAPGLGSPGALDAFRASAYSCPARENPFASGRVLAVRFRFPHGDDIETVIERLEALRWRGAVVGLEGRGKTRLLEELGQALESRGRGVSWTRVTRERPHLEPGLLRELGGGAFSERILFLDGAEQLSGWAWRRVRRSSRRAAGLVIAAQRAGLLPTLLECTTSPELLEEIVEELLGAAGRVLSPLTRELFRKHSGNLRDSLRELYDLWSDRGQDLLSGH